MKLKKNLVIFPFLVTLHLVAQHRSDYMQYMFNGLLVNPAYAGSQEALNITALYRKQWAGFNGAPVTASFAGHSPLKNQKSNIGVIVMNDCFGIYNHNMINLVYAYRVRLGNGYLSLGIQGGIDAYSANWNKVNTTDKNDPGFQQVNDKKTVFNAGFGTYYYSKKFYLGFSMPELFDDNISKYRTQVVHGGFLINSEGNLKIKPSMMMKYIYNSPLSTNIATTFYWKDIIGLGIGYTINTSALAIIDIKVNDQFRVGYGYDHPLNKLRTYTSGSHELMLRYIFKYKIDALSTRYF
jgi:type IX secretion system PorP/SprF family membrane protein